MGVNLEKLDPKRSSKSGSEFQFSFKLNGQEKTYTVDVDSVFSVGEDLKQELTDHPSMVAWLSVLASVYTKKAASAKDNLKVVEADLVARKKRELINAGERAAEYFIKSLVYSDPEYRAAAKLLRKAEHDNNIIIGFRKALDHKRDCLVQLNGLYKKELESQIGGLNNGN